MRTKLATYALAGALGLTGVAGATLAVPALSYAATGDSTTLDDRVSPLTAALAGLVSDGTLSQAQADRVATTLAEARPGRGHGGRGHGGGRLALPVLEELGITAEEVRAAAEAGTTLGQLALDNGVSRERLVDALVAAHQERLAEAVSSGRLTQAEADERSATLEEHLTERLDQPVGRHGGGKGQRGS